jgi:hypothetical protein
VRVGRVANTEPVAPTVTLPLIDQKFQYFALSGGQYVLTIVEGL